MASFSNNYAIYIVEAEPIKQRGGGGILLSRQLNIAIATPSVKKKRKNQKLITPIYCE
jgi:hypothetical protein